MVELKFSCEISGFYLSFITSSETCLVQGEGRVHCPPLVRYFRQYPLRGSRRRPVTRTEPFLFLKQMSNRCAYGRRLGVRGFPLQVQRKVPGAAGQQTVWTVAPVT